MKIAIVHDKLVCTGGAEQVALSFHKAFPEAPIYTLSYDPEHTYSQFRNCQVRSSWFGRIFKKEQNVKRFYFPLGILAMTQLDLSGYDVILQSATHCAKYVKAAPGALVITYCHNPFRLAWSPESYDKVLKSNQIKRATYKAIIWILRKIDKAYADKTHWFITNSNVVVERISAAYSPSQSITVINPPVDCQKFHVNQKTDDYYLVVSRFEAYKRVDLVIEAFNQMPDKKLIIVGKGTLEAKLKSIAGNNVTFLNRLSAEQLSETYANCKALIFPQLEDYGITPLEANASGRPVIAYGKGGVLETMIPYTADASTATAVFFDDQTTASLIDAIKRFELLEFDSQFIRRHAEEFDELGFVRKIRSFVRSKYNGFHEHQGPIIIEDAPKEQVAI